jgi:ribosomal-protein-alanine N-acetyltransferase
MQLIRPATPADVDALLVLRVANRAHLERWEPDAQPADRRYTRAGVEDWVARDHQFVIVADGTVAGVVQLSNVVVDSLASAMVGYWLAADRGGRGLATRAVGELVDHAFGDLGLHRVEAGTAVANLPSQRVLERNRFTKVGLLRRHLLIGGEWVDHYLWERIVGD